MRTSRVVMLRIATVFGLFAVWMGVPACGGGGETPGVDAGATSPDAPTMADAFVPNNEVQCPTQADVGCGPWFGGWFEQVLAAGEAPLDVRFVDVAQDMVLAERDGDPATPVLITPLVSGLWDELRMAELPDDAPALVAVAAGWHVGLDNVMNLALLCEAELSPAERQCWVYEANWTDGALEPLFAAPLPTVEIRGLAFHDGDVYVYGDGVYTRGADDWVAVVEPGTGGVLFASSRGDEGNLLALVGAGGRMIVPDDGAWVERDTGVTTDLLSVSVYGNTAIAGGVDGTLLLSDLRDTDAEAFEVCAPIGEDIAAVLWEPWGAGFFLGIASGELFGAQGDTLCVKSPASPSAFVALSGASDGTCSVMYAVTADAVYRETLNCTD